MPRTSQLDVSNPGKQKFTDAVNPNVRKRVWRLVAR
jgi:hypothetical protein